MKQAIDAINNVLPSDSKKLTREAVQAWKKFGIGPDADSDFRGKPGEWQLHDVYVAYRFKLMTDLGINREIAAKWNSEARNSAISSIIHEEFEKDGAVPEWFDIYRDVNGNEWFALADQNWRAGEDGGKKAVLLMSINVYESLRVIKKALSKV